MRDRCRPNDEALYDLAREMCHEEGEPWTDPRTGKTYPPPQPVGKPVVPDIGSGPQGE